MQERSMPGGCPGPTRRDALRAGALTALGLSLPAWFRSRAKAHDRPATQAARSCILIWLDGGPSHLDTFDLKPAAPSEVRGPFAPIDTSVAGVKISELLPQTARIADRLAIVRSMTSTLGEHNFGSQYLLTGYRPSAALEYPSYGAVLAHVRHDPQALPPYVAVPDFNAAAGAGFLSLGGLPFSVGGDPGSREFRVRDLDAYANIDERRLARRREFLAAFDEGPAMAGRAATGDEPFAQAYRLLSSPAAKQAFDLAAEPEDVRQRYGPRTIGQSCLLARRLVESGVPFVTVTDRGWDTHDKLVNRLQEGYTGGAVGKIPSLDLAYSALIADLAERGLLDETLVLLMGEFGRTPKINTLGGRDHWPRVFSVVLAGGGVRGGQVLGASDAHGESPHDRPVLPEELARTIYTLLGIDPDLELSTADGRPVKINQASNVVAELLA